MHEPGEWDATVECICACVRMGGDLDTLTATRGDMVLTAVVRREVIRRALQSEPAGLQGSSLPRRPR